MNKKEIAEIKKQFCAERCTIDRICSCYVDGEKNIRTTIGAGLSRLLGLVNLSNT